MCYGYRILADNMTRPIPLLDLASLWLDRPETPANVGVVMLLAPPAGCRSSAVARQIVRAYRAASPAHPFDCVPDLRSLGLPHWRPATRVDLRRHVFLDALPAPGGLEQLCRHVARLHETPLDRTRPLFAVHVIEGLEAGLLAVYVKSHHASWDGRYALERIFGSMPHEAGAVAPPFYAAVPGMETPTAEPPLPSALLGGALRAGLAQATALRELFGKLAAPADRTQARVHGNRPFAGPHTRLNEPVSAGRSFACCSLDIEALRRVARSVGATLNDVALAVVDAGVERYLASLGERPRQPLVAMCPVSLREPGDHEATTKAATLFVPLGTPRSGGVRRLREIVANTGAAKAEFREFTHEAALDYALLAFGLWFVSSKLGLGAITRPVINLVISNVGAVEGARYVGPCRVVGAYPISMLADPTGLNVTILSVDGHMDFGIVANAAAIPDAAPLARACEAAFAQLQRSAARAGAGRGPRGRERPARTVTT